MTLISANDIEVKKYSEIVRKDIEIYKDTVNEFLTLFTGVPSSSLEWVGPDADRYYNNVDLEKGQYESFYDNFISFLDELDKSIGDFSNSITYRE